ncbi:Panacea domain-containing protein [Collimonas sp.]|jgi:uncharacterized phage-associated protein|uniref:Panacea domain-containing protein n=1 Tax=Collimonas sp. TaxID=1963772 RepID=UPI002C9423C7|nr:Panacea domain-containing protein [Collimonas sp.]HWX02434.1 Panacea domain-containing protein [Collimonas sp.]
MFKERKAAQMAAVLLGKAGGSLNVLKLTKLLYLAERESMSRSGFPIAGDYMVSMPKGPVLSQTLNLTNGEVVSEDWEHWVEDRENHQVKLKRPFTREDVDSLSDAAMDVLNDVWKQFGEMTQWDLVEYTHNECAEWEDPGKSSHPIPAKRVFIALGKSKEEAEILTRELQAQKYFDCLLEGA